MKTILKIVLFVALFAVIACLTACTDNSFKNADYVEVESLRIDSANVYMAPSGEPQTYKLEVGFLPVNATNRALDFYIPSDYYQYVTVSSSGVLTAHSITPDDLFVPCTITSTTNKKAKLVVSIKVESRPVERVVFNQEEINMLYNGSPTTVSVSVYPSHAIDGRVPSYDSTNEAVATVDETTGLVTPVGAGNCRIVATCSTRSGTQVKAWLPCTVSYAKGQYQLLVSGDPQYNQVIGSFNPIEFSLLVTGENSDPNPSIEWYYNVGLDGKGGERDATASNARQYSHTPSATTSISYYIQARIQPYGLEQVTLQSKLITIYPPFKGIEINYENQSSAYTSYFYGEEVTFNVPSSDASNVERYTWWLKELNGTGESVLVGETTPTNKHFTTRLNISGDYTLTCNALNGTGNTIRQEVAYNFNVERLLTGDTLVVDAGPYNNGLPPDSYHWYVVNCNNNGDYTLSYDNKIADVAAGKLLYYMVNNPGYYRLVATVSINGELARNGKDENGDGEEDIYVYVSDVLHIFSTTEQDTADPLDIIDIIDDSNNVFFVHNYSSIDDIVIEGLTFNGTSYVYLNWNNVSRKTYNYIIELVVGEDYYLIDPLDNKIDGFVFGPNFCYISPYLTGSDDLFTINSPFSVRIKYKNEIYSNKYFYATSNSNVANYTPKYSSNVPGYFNAVSINATEEPTNSSSPLMLKPALNLYISNIYELKDLFTYIVLFRPTYVSEFTITNNNDKLNYSFNMYLGFAYSNNIESIYPSNLSNVELSSVNNPDLYRMIVGVLENSGFKYEYSLDITNIGTNEYTVVISLPSDLNANTSTESTAVGLVAAGSIFIDDTTYSASRYPIELSINGYCNTSDQLLYILENGYLPSPRVSTLSSLYATIKTTVKSLVNESMTTEEILLIFYDYLNLRISKDTTLSTTLSESELALYASNKLEGVFNKKQATYIGLCKAFVAMCGVMNIPCSLETAYINGESHTACKVLVNSNWYIVDFFLGQYVCGTMQTSNHIGFLLTDSEYDALFSTNEVKAFVTGIATANLSSNIYDMVLNGIDFTILDSSYLLSAINLITNSGTYAFDLLFDSGNFYDFNDVQSFIAGLIESVDFLPSDITINATIYELESLNGNCRAMVIITKE